MSAKKEMSFSAAAREFFGLKPGETLTDFIKELRALTRKDKEELALMLSQEMDCVVILA